MSTSGITCSACLTGKIKTDTPTGNVEKIFGRDTYVARPSDSKTSAASNTASASGVDSGQKLANAEGVTDGKGIQKAKGTIVILPDLFGWAVSNCRLLADSYAREGGFLVLLPDFMDGSSPPFPSPGSLPSFLFNHIPSILDPFPFFSFYLTKHQHQHQTQAQPHPPGQCAPWTPSSPPPPHSSQPSSKSLSGHSKSPLKPYPSYFATKNPSSCLACLNSIVHFAILRRLRWRA